MKQDLEDPPIDEKLLRFMTEECDSSIEHADGSLQNIWYMDMSMLMILSSVFCSGDAVAFYLGTGSNTFAMEASKIPCLQTANGI